MSEASNTLLELEEIAAPLINIFDKYQQIFISWLKLHQLLVDGKPVSSKRIANHLGIAQEKVARLLEGAELDSEGNLVGLGLSIVPTPHSYRIEDRQLYVWCAGDAISFPIFHQTEVEIESPDPVSGEMVRLVSTPNGIQDLSPSTAVVSWVRTEASPKEARMKFCNYTNFFTSAATASEYIAEHPGMIIVQVEQVFEIGRLLWEREPYKSMADELSLRENLDK